MMDISHIWFKSIRGWSFVFREGNVMYYEHSFSLERGYVCISGGGYNPLNYEFLDGKYPRRKYEF